jgi:hypothetical protein
MSTDEGFDGETHIGLVIDRSGSMRWTNPHATKDLAKWLEGVQGAPGSERTDMRVVYFDEQFEHEKRKPLDDWSGLEVQPRGSTALYDATAQMIRKLDKTDADDSRTLVVVITDGQENASTEFDVDKDGWKRLQKVMRKRTKTGRWTFVFLAAELHSVSSRNMTKGAGAGNVSAQGMGYMGDRGVIDTRSYLRSGKAQDDAFVKPEAVPDEDDAAETPQPSVTP